MSKEKEFNKDQKKMGMLMKHPQRKKSPKRTSKSSIDILVGVNLLREGLDLPEVTLVAILDADKEGFLRSGQALIQTAGRAARNSEGRIILYADKITRSMKKLLDETDYRRKKQIAHNELHGITPTTIVKKNEDIFSEALGRKRVEDEYDDAEGSVEAKAEYLNQEDLEKTIRSVRKHMEIAAKDLNFIEAARLRDELFALQGVLKDRK